MSSQQNKWASWQQLKAKPTPPTVAVVEPAFVEPPKREVEPATFVPVEDKPILGKFTKKSKSIEPVEDGIEN